MLNTCEHCGEKILFTSEIGNFCCMGCRVAHTLINSLDLNEYYRYCREIYNGRPMKVNTNIKNKIDYLQHIKMDSDSNTNQITLLIDGMHCGACAWLIESSLKKHGLQIARLNMSTRKLTLEWIGLPEKINEIISLIDVLGYRASPFDVTQYVTHVEQEEKNLLKCLFVSGFVSIQVMMIAMIIWISHWYGGMEQYTRYILHLFIAASSIPAIAYSCRPFFKSAITAVKAGRSDMNIPISIGIIATTMISIQETVLMHDYTYYDAAISLSFVLLIGRYIDLKTRNKAKAAAHQLLLNQPRYVTLEIDGKLELVQISNASPGQIAVVESGERVPVDAILLDSEAMVDNSIITGETVPQNLKSGDMVYAGVLNLGNAIRLQIEKLGDDTVLNSIVKLIEVAQQGKAKYVKIADRVSRLYTPVILSLATLTTIAWKFILYASLPESLLYGVCVLIVTCPCALALAVPIVQIVASLKLMKQGSIIKTQNALEKMSKIDTIVLDKTGVLTHGKMNLQNARDIPEEYLPLIASIASKSKHPICMAIREQYKEKLLPVEVMEEKGFGLSAKYGTCVYLLGSKRWCGIDDGEVVDGYVEAWFTIKKSILDTSSNVGIQEESMISLDSTLHEDDNNHISNNIKPIRLIFEDNLRDEASNIVSKLKELGYKLFILSGDRESAVKKIANIVNIREYNALATPEIKHNFIKNLQAEGKKVLMVGDGLNDSAALSVADASISPASAIGIAQNSADIVFQGGLHSIIDNLMIAKYSSIIVEQNFAIALLYNIATIPIAMCGLITPVIASIAMSTSSIIVVLNAMRINSYVGKDIK